MRDPKWLEVDRLGDVLKTAEQLRDDSAKRLSLTVVFFDESKNTPARRWRCLRGDILEFKKNQQAVVAAANAYMDAYYATKATESA